MAVVGFLAIKLESRKKLARNSVSSDKKQLKAKNIVMRYRTEDQKGEVVADLMEADLISQEISDINLTRPKGFIIEGDNKLHYQALRGVLPKGNRFVKLTDDVNFQLGFHEMSGDVFIYRTNSQKLYGRGNIELNSKDQKDRIELKSNELNYYLNNNYFSLKGDITGKVKKPRAYQVPIYLESQKLSYSAAESFIAFEEDVLVEMGPRSMKALKGNIFLDNYSKNLKYYVLHDDIEYVESFLNEQGEQVQRKAYSQKLEGFVRGNKVILSGAPEVRQEKNIIRGYQITVFGDSELLEVDESRANFKVEK